MMKSNKHSGLFYSSLDSEHLRIHLGHISELFSAAVRVSRALLSKQA